MLQTFLNSFLATWTVAPLALAFGIVYKSTGIFHLAVGAIYALMPYITLSLMRKGLPVATAFLGASVVGVLVSMGLEICNHRPLMRKGASPVGHFVTSLGVYMSTPPLITALWGPDVQSLRSTGQAAVSVGPFVISVGQLVSSSIAIIALAIFYVWLSASATGLKLRALASNPTEAALRGLDVASLRLLGFGISGLLCAVAALPVAWDVGFDPYSALTPTVLAIAAGAVGGWGSFWGPAVGSLFISLVRGIAMILLSPQWQDAATFLGLAILLYIRPTGILSPRQREGIKSE